MKGVAAENRYSLAILFQTIGPKFQTIGPKDRSKMVDRSFGPIVWNFGPIVWKYEVWKSTGLVLRNFFKAYSLEFWAYSLENRHLRLSVQRSLATRFEVWL